MTVTGAGERRLRTDMFPDLPPNDDAVIHLKGALRAPTDGNLTLQVAALLRIGHRRILVDLAGVSDLDAAGLGELVAAHNMAIAENGELRITHAGGRAGTMLDRSGLLRVLTVDPERLQESEVSLPPAGDRQGRQSAALNARGR